MSERLWKMIVSKMFNHQEIKSRLRARTLRQSSLCRGHGMFLIDSSSRPLVAALHISWSASFTSTPSQGWISHAWRFMTWTWLCYPRTWDDGSITYLAAFFYCTSSDLDTPGSLACYHVNTTTLTSSYWGESLVIWAIAWDICQIQDTEGNSITSRLSDTWDSQCEQEIVQLQNMVVRCFLASRYVLWSQHISSYLCK